MDEDQTQKYKQEIEKACDVRKYYFKTYYRQNKRGRIVDVEVKIKTINNVYKKFN